MANKTTRSGEILGVQPIKRLSKASDIEHTREYLRRTKDPPIRSRRVHKAKIGEDPDEQRAVQGLEGTILERIVYRRLTLLLGPEGTGWIFQHGIGGARIFKGGYVLDFVVDYPRRLALEVQGAFWHGPESTFRDVARALAVMAEGYEYAEILEHEVWLGDQYLDFRLQQVLGL